MVNCTFCNSIVRRGTGLIFVQKTGRILNFCSSKCEKNMLKLGRKARTVKWTGHYEKGAKK